MCIGFFLEIGARQGVMKFPARWQNQAYSVVNRMTRLLQVLPASSKDAKVVLKSSAKELTEYTGCSDNSKSGPSWLFVGSEICQGWLALAASS